MYLFEFVQEVHEQTHLGELEILDLARRAWPHQHEFTPKHVKVLVRQIEHDQQAFHPLTVDQLWGEVEA